MEAAFLVPSQFTFLNLNTLNATTHPKERREHILILTPLKNASPYLGRHFELLDRLSYPKELISIAFLVSDTTDDTVQMLKEYADIFLNRPNRADRFHRIQVFEKDFHYELPEDKRHTYALQPLRRSVMARSRNYLLNTALNEEHSWVLWLDVDIVDYPETVLEDLMSVNVDVVVPNCLLKREDGQFWGYDKNNWQETEESLALQKDLDPDFVFLEGMNDYLCHIANN
ncbi:hypothetical protein BC938DRAFT_481680 [Jimgerdemannia flammicorona]|uniref:Anp1-domain-containing protein n=1 Tax=Jimgerdemannia flammicorona TaxID=994334 RepID=A0A433QWP4_9FUNG|nr:hypothetical protein BC938DRAFT_481680 [Jimgerdemannia flammicorona]